MRIAFLGLGRMGFAIAGRLAEAGHDLLVYNRSAERTDAWLQRYSGVVALSPQLACMGADIVITCLADDAAMKAIYFGDDGVMTLIAPNTLCIDHSSISAELTRELAQKLNQRGALFVDAPVSGGVQGAETGRLTVMAGGSAEALRKVEPIAQCYARRVTHVGPVGSGQLCKMANQLCVAATVQGLAEAIYFAEATGLEPEIMLRAIAKGAAGSWQLDHRAPTMLNGAYDAGFAVELMHKDMNLALAEAAQEGITLPSSDALLNQYQTLLQAGESDTDIGCVLKLLRQAAKPEN